MTKLVPLVLVAATIACGSPAQAQDLKYFYCYAVDHEKQQVIVSDVQEVGAIAERASYGKKFVEYLSSKALSSPASAPYCVMRATLPEIDRGLGDLPRHCPECLGLAKFATVPWPRNGKSLGTLLKGKLPSAAVSSAPPLLDMASPSAAKSASIDGGGNEPSRGLWIKVRVDLPDAIMAENKGNEIALLGHRAQLRGGRWDTLLANDRCPGWGAIAYVLKDRALKYFVARGKSSPAIAAKDALSKADSYAVKFGSLAHLLMTYDNQYQSSVSQTLDESDDTLIGGTAALIRSHVSDPCVNAMDRASVGGPRD